MPVVGAPFLRLQSCLVTSQAPVREKSLKKSITPTVKEVHPPNPHE